ncbi:MAG: thermonuclease family protein [Calothrix sp. MO_192.B10]|nr:thermonuclease family protein [Calothrix sp. MO_192.B10]
MKHLLRNLVTLGAIIAVIGVAAVVTKNRRTEPPQVGYAPGRVVPKAPPIDWTVTKPAYDGDTISVSRNGEKLKVRFACIDAPELAQPLGKESRDYLRSLIDSSRGKVGLNVIKSDRYGRSVAEVWIDTPQRGKELVQSLMVVKGLAYAYEQYKDDCPTWEGVKAAQDSAKQLRLGVWSGNYQEPWAYRR